MAPWLPGLGLFSASGGGALRAEGMPDPASGVACLGTLYVGQLPDLPGARLQLVRQGERLHAHALYPSEAPATPAGARGEERRPEIDGRVDADGRFVLTEAGPGAEGEPVAGRFAGTFDANGVAAGHWESAAGDRRLAFVLTPTDRAGTADGPAFALSCRPDADGMEQLYLEVAGQVPLELRGVEADSLRGGEVRFDPVSLSVRRLDGEPPLLAIEYDHDAFEAGGVPSEYRRTLVVPVGEGGGALVDRWTRVFSDYRWGFFGSLPGPAVDAADMDPHELLARVERHRRDCRESQGGPLPRARRVPPETRLTVGAGVRVRPAPRPGCGLLERLPTGTPVKLRQRTAEKTRVGAETDHWYQIETPAGVSGWVFGALLTPLDPAHPGRAWRAIIERQRGSAPEGLRAAVDWLDWLGRVRPKLPPELVADWELARLDGLRAVAEATGLGLGLSPLGSPWAAPHLVGLDAFIEGDGLDLGAAYRAWHDRYPGHPAAEHAAWQPTINPTWLDFGLIPSWGYDDEGDGEDLSYHLRLLADNPFVRYLRLHPRGAHAAEARREVEDTIKSLSVATDGYGDALGTPELVCQDEVLPALRSASADLESIAGEQAAALRTRIAALLRIECPPTAAQPSAGDSVGAAPGEP